MIYTINILRCLDNAIWADNTLGNKHNLAGCYNLKHDGKNLWKFLLIKYFDKIFHLGLYAGVWFLIHSENEKIA